MNAEAELSDETLLNLVPNAVRFQNDDVATTFYESIRIVIAVFRSGQLNFDYADEYTKVQALYKALEIAVKKNETSDWADIALRYDELSLNAFKNLEYRAQLQNKNLPSPNDFRVASNRGENARILMSILNLGETKAENGQRKPILWVRRKKEKTDRKTEDYETLVKGLAVAWDRAFEQGNGKYSANTRSKRDTPTPFVAFCRQLFGFLNLPATINIENIVNHLN